MCSRCRWNLQFGNVTLSFGRLRKRIVLKFVRHVQHDYFFSFNQSDHCFLALLLSLASSLLKFSTKKLTSPSVVIPSAKMKNEKTEGQRWKCQLSSPSFDAGWQFDFHQHAWRDVGCLSHFPRGRVNIKWYIHFSSRKEPGHMRAGYNFDQRQHQQQPKG